MEELVEYVSVELLLSNWLVYTASLKLATSVDQRGIVTCGISLAEY